MNPRGRALWFASGATPPPRAWMNLLLFGGQRDRFHASPARVDEPHKDFSLGLRLQLPPWRVVDEPGDLGEETSRKVSPPKLGVYGPDRSIFLPHKAVPPLGDDDETAAW